MLVIVVATALILGIACFQILQGVFSALIMTILTILCAVLGFTYYEPLAEALFYNKLSAYADAVCLIGLFALPLLVLRFLYDALIRANVVLGVWADRIGGGALGIITGMIIVGVLLIGLQMLPFGPSVMTYRPFDDSLQRVGRVPPFYPDDFTLGLMKMLSRGSLSGNRSFADAHDDLLLETFCARNTGGLHGRVDAPTDALASVSAFAPPPGQIPGVPEGDIPRNPLLDEEVLDKIVVVKAVLTSTATHEKDEWWRLPGTHFRLVTNASRSHYPVAYLTYGTTDDRGALSVSGGWECHAAEIMEELENRAALTKLAIKRPSRDSSGDVPKLAVDWIYRLPASESPAYLVFRRTSKKSIPKASKRPPPNAGSLRRKVKGRRR